MNRNDIDIEKTLSELLRYGFCAIRGLAKQSKHSPKQEYLEDIFAFADVLHNIPSDLYERNYDQLVYRLEYVIKISKNSGIDWPTLKMHAQAALDILTRGQTIPSPARHH